MNLLLCTLACLLLFALSFAAGYWWRGTRQTPLQRRYARMHRQGWWRRVYEGKSLGDSVRVEGTVVTFPRRPPPGGAA